MAEPSLRLDKFLWFARIAKTRPLAHAMVEEGRMRLDGRVVERASTPVRVGSVLTFAHHGSVRVLRVEKLPARRGPAPEAAPCIPELANQPPVAVPVLAK